MGNDYAVPNFQEQFYDETVHYETGSPHLTHEALRRRLTAIARAVFSDLAGSGLAPNVLEVGAGHGGYTEPMLAAGARVTAVEMSEHSVRRLNGLFGHNTNFKVIYEPSGAPPITGSYGMVMCVSVLHHVPDYFSFVDALVARVRPGGALVTLQDPLWYPKRAVTHRLDRAAYLMWRLGRGNLRQGISTQVRRLRGLVDETNPSDMVEYHVVRSGIDESALVERIAPWFEHVQLVQYWSHQSAIGQRAGERVGLRNTFGIVATGRQ